MSMPKQGVSRTLIVGIGSAHGDDQVGWLVAEQLRDYAGQSDFELQIAKSPVDLLDWIEGIDRLAICDACCGLGAVGELYRWTWPAPEISGFAMSGTHNLALPTVLNLAEKLNRLPSEIVIWAIEGAVSKSNAGVSPEVAETIPVLVDRIMNELNAANLTGAKVCTNKR